MQDFEHELKLHMLHQLPGGNVLSPEYVPTDSDLFHVHIKGDHLYQHKVLCINYTQYDMHYNQDSINPHTHPNIIMLMPDGTLYPYLYAYMLGIFHIMAYLAGDDLDGADNTELETVHILWVHWFDLDPHVLGGFKVCHLPQLKWVTLDDNMFGFVSPNQVLCTVHLMPAFTHGQSDAALPGFSVACHEDEEDTD